MPDKRYVRAQRNRSITLAILSGETLATISEAHGVSRERVRQIVTRELGRAADTFHEPVPTIPQARQNATRWRSLLAGIPTKGDPQS